MPSEPLRHVPDVLHGVSVKVTAGDVLVVFAPGDAAWWYGDLADALRERFPDNPVIVMQEGYALEVRDSSLDDAKLRWT